MTTYLKRKAVPLLMIVDLFLAIWQTHNAKLVSVFDHSLGMTILCNVIIKTVIMFILTAFAYTALNRIHSKVDDYGKPST